MIKRRVEPDLLKGLGKHGGIVLTAFLAPADLPSLQPYHSLNLLSHKSGYPPDMLHHIVLLVHLHIL